MKSCDNCDRFGSGVCRSAKPCFTGKENRFTYWQPKSNKEEKSCYTCMFKGATGINPCVKCSSTHYRFWQSSTAQLAKERYDSCRDRLHPVENKDIRIKRLFFTGDERTRLGLDSTREILSKKINEIIDRINNV